MHMVWSRDAYHVHSSGCSEAAQLLNEGGIMGVAVGEVILVV